MGFAAVAGHLVILVALLSAGTVLVAAVGDNLTDTVDARVEALHRERAARAEELTLTNASLQDQNLTTTWRHDGSEEIALDDLTLLVDGAWTDPDTVATFEVQEAPNSSVLMPGETLEVETTEGDTSVTLVGPHGTAAYRRP